MAKILDEIGKWLKANGEAIYNTRNTPMYHDGNVWFTASKDKQTIYAIVCPGGPMPGTVSWHGNLPTKGTKMVVLATGQRMKYKIKDGQVEVSLPSAVLATGMPVVLKYNWSAGLQVDSPVFWIFHVVGDHKGSRFPCV